MSSNSIVYKVMSPPCSKATRQPPTDLRIKPSLFTMAFRSLHHLAPPTSSTHPAPFSPSTTVFQTHCSFCTSDRLVCSQLRPSVLIILFLWKDLPLLLILPDPWSPFGTQPKCRLFGGVYRDHSTSRFPPITSPSFTLTYIIVDVVPISPRSYQSFMSVSSIKCELTPSSAVSYSENLAG